MTTQPTNHTCLQELTPQERAEDMLACVLAMQWDRTPAMILDSPPGAGKTGVAVRIAGMSMAMMKERCVLVTQTNAQAMDVAGRLCARYSTRSIYLFVRKGLELPSALTLRSNLIVVHSDKDLPLEPSIVVGNAAKWSWVREDIEPFDLMIVDEAYQLPDFRFWQIANLAERVVLIGDPGQIEPVITSDVTRWASNEIGPHRPCPETLLHHFPELPVLQLPVSRRLRASTVAVVQPAFYPELPFEAFDAESTRGLLIEDCEHLDPDVHAAMAHIEAGQSLAGVVLPALLTGEHDPELSGVIARTARELVGSVVEDMGESRLKPEDIGITCAHRSQVQAVRERLGSGMDGVLVETADRFQGLERKVMLVHHPLSGRSDASEFHLDVGRLCVMLTRHRVACLVFWRSGIRDVLGSVTVGGDRPLGQTEDREHSGRRAHRRLLDSLCSTTHQERQEFM
jgi:hypothetical protein